ncbi:MAG TPA: hypothetical protein VIH99_06150 [Bdellovibrionota bacterium]|jgi:hypothetical protein
MALFRRNTIFHVEESLPDPEDLKLRFRRRVLLVSAIAFLTLLGFPVARELRTNLNARSEARRFAESMIKARTLATVSRVPVALEIAPDRQGWVQAFYTSGESCGSEAPGPRTLINTEGVFWKLQAQQENGTAISGKKLCFHPRKGLLLDSVALDEGKLLVTLSGSEEGAPERELASVLVTRAGAELATISY